MIQVRCPQCGTLNQVAAGSGAIQVSCYACKTVFPATSSEGTTPALGSTPAGTGGPSAYPPGAYPPGAYPPGAYPPDAHPPGANPPGFTVPTPIVPSPAGGPIPPHLAGVQGGSNAPQAVAAVTGGGALDSAVVDNEAVAPSPDRSGGLLIVLLVAATVFVLLGAALLATLLVVGGKLPSSGNEPGHEVGAVRPGHEVGADRPSVHWSDAASKTLEIDEMRVRIDRAEWGQVRGRDREGKVITTGENYLSIIVNVKNHGQATTLYESWHEGPHPAVLMDEASQVFEPFSVSRFRSIEWHIAGESLEKMQQVDDRLVFVVPPNVNRDLVDAFRLELPAEAVGRKGVYRFRITVDMIEGY